jgi:predicted ArsR family transcriptional regulator
VKFPSPGAERVARALHDGGPSTAASLAQGLGLSGAVVRRHLDALVEQGLVSASNRPPFGPTPQRGRGRPARVFALTDRGSHAFDLAYDDLALSALRFLAEHESVNDAGGESDSTSDRADATSGDVGTDRVAQFARHRAGVWSQHLKDDFDSIPDVGDRVDALVAVLTEEGYAATSVRGEGSAVQICQHHCPISHVAEQFPQLCEAETLAFERLLGTHVMRLATIAHGDGVCTTLVPVANSASAGPETTTASSRGGRVR